ncbi:fibrous sheath-interacting protein 1 isoform X3 [Hyla sarda]|uniref:fibrous sheath-interacting protein 1 isoform X3 n=1 Tax=Hyla sarda TaxID=327740 RepID=UPI0024C3C976|nr:fibrous sheath-interacting protein 1 isoform X3 [Hyla sarda]
MDIMKGSLDDISRPATVSRSRPGSRLLSSFQVDKQKVNSSLCSLEVLTPEPGMSQWEPTVTADDEQDTSPQLGSDDPGDEKTPQSRTRIGVGLYQNKMTSSPEDPVFCSGNGECKDESQNNETAGKTRNGFQDGSTERPQSTEDNIDPKLEKAFKKMKVLDEVLLRKVAKEKEVKVQGLEMRKQLWEDLQHVSQQSSARSHDENVNTNKFLALTPNLDDTEADTDVFEKMFPPLFSTQLPPEDCIEDLEDSQAIPVISASAIVGNVSGVESCDLLSSSKRSDHKKMQGKSTDYKRVNFIHRNIELVKDAGSHILLMDDEKLRLEQLLGDVQDGGSDDDIMAGVPLWLVPAEGYTAEPDDLDRLAQIEAQLQMFSSIEDSVVADDDHSVRESLQEVSAVKCGNLETSPGEKVLRYTKELREQKVRLKEIDQCLEDIQRSNSSESCSSLWMYIRREEKQRDVDHSPLMQSCVLYFLHIGSDGQ